MLDNQFHKDSINALRVQDQPIALVFGFESSQRRSLAANLLCLSGELENAIRIPKEPMLAAIRVQWWHDTLSDDSNENQINLAPLIVRLRSYIRDDKIKRSDILKLIEAWQACAIDETASSIDAWGICWYLIGTYLGNDNIADTAKSVTITLHGEKMSDNPAKPLFDNAYFGDIRLKAKQNGQWWLYFAAIIGYRKQLDRDALNNDHLLVWRFLGWRLFGFTVPN